ncbi:MAG: carbohydrate-binding protein [Spirochaetales bacterium]|nr:carbohydrate-binding protein [Spirochaetales bacterium]
MWLIKKKFYYFVFLLLSFILFYGICHAKNPFIHSIYTADPSARVWADGRLYVYPSRDIDPNQGCDLMDRYHVFSTADMVTWVDEGEILRASQVPWGRPEGGFMWAPDCIYRNGTYYYYFPHPSGTDWGSTWKTGIATSSLPERGFTVQGYIPGLESLIDPNVFIDDDGQAYFYYGGGNICKGGRLADNMMEIDGTMQDMQGLVDFHEATWVFKRNGIYYLTYADNHSDSSGDNRMCYATGSNPLGPWTYRGIIMDPTDSFCAHGSIVEYKGQWYVFYFNSFLSNNDWLRSICVDRLYFNGDGTIQKVIQTETGPAAAGPTATPYPNVTRYEAENAVLGNGVTIASDDSASAGGCVHNLNLSGSYCRFDNVNGGNGGRATVHIYYATNDTGAKVNLSANGIEYLFVNTPYTGGWSDFSGHSCLTVPLNAGTSNTITFTGGNLGVNIDYITVVSFNDSALPTGTPSPTPANSTLQQPYEGTAASINNGSRIEAERYDAGGEGIAYHDTTSGNSGNAFRSDDVDIESCGDSGGGYNVGWMREGEWLEYTVNASGGTYAITVRVASAGSGTVGDLRMLLDGSVLGTFPIDLTGGWQSYVSVTLNGIAIADGNGKILRLEVVNGGDFNVNYIQFGSSGATATPTPTQAATSTLTRTSTATPTRTAAATPTRTQTPAATSTPTQVSGTLEDITNAGGTVTAQYYDSPTGEDISKLIDNLSSSKYLTFHASGWVQYYYTVPSVITRYTITSANDVPDRDPFSWTLQGSTNGSSWVTLDTRSNEDFPNRFQLRGFNFINTVSYTYYRLNMSNNAGTILQIAEWELYGTTGGSTATPTAIRTATSTPTRSSTPTPPANTPTPVTGQQPYGGTAAAISNGARIEAERYDTGGEGIAYHDTTGGNTGGAFRSEDVDMENCGDAGGGYNVGWIIDGEWLEYTVNVTAGTYNITVRVASAGSGTIGDLRILLDGAVLGTFSVGSTGNWQSYTDSVLNNVTLAGGTNRILRLEMVNGGDFNINYILFNATNTSTPTPTPTVQAGSGDIFNKVYAGYQGWFTCYGDGSPVDRWFHWSNGTYQSNAGAPAPGAVKFELYPDVREYTNLYQTNLGSLNNGQPARLFSSYSEQTVNKHFEWMQTYGIDGAALQRFGSELADSVFKAHRDSVGTKVRNAAQTYGRKFYIMYDVSGMGADFNSVLQSDWTNTITGTLNLTSSSAYAKQDGKPVVCIWGLGFTDRPGDATSSLNLVNWFKSQGCYVIGGVPTHWRTSSDDSKPGFENVYRAYDMISPWSVGRFGDQAGADNFKNNQLIPDLEYCNTYGIAYQPVMFAGFAWSNWNGGSRNQIPRQHGDFMWRQAYNIKSLGINAAYIAMFDEYDEATAIAKAAENSSMIPNNQYFLTLDADGVACSADFYLRLSGDITRMIRGEIPMTTSHPTSHQ